MYKEVFCKVFKFVEEFFIVFFCLFCFNLLNMLLFVGSSGGLFLFVREGLFILGMFGLLVIGGGKGS